MRLQNKVDKFRKKKISAGMPDSQSCQPLPGRVVNHILQQTLQCLQCLSHPRSHIWSLRELLWLCLIKPSELFQWPWDPSPTFWNHMPIEFPISQGNVGAVGLVCLAGFGRRRDDSQTGIQNNQGWRHRQNILKKGKHFSSKALLQAWNKCADC